MAWTGSKKKGSPPKSGLADALEEVAEVSAIVKRSKDEQARFVSVTDSEHWVCLCFRTRADKEAFLRGVGHTLANGDKYVNGHALAGRLGVALPSAGPVTRGRQSAKRWAELASAPGAAGVPTGSREASTRKTAAESSGGAGGAGGAFVAGHEPEGGE